MEGWIKTYRKMTEWEWFSDSVVVHVFLFCLLMANNRDRYWQGILVKRGEFITSVDKISRTLNLSIQQTRTALKKLKSTNEITIESTNRYTRITISNYASYQSNEDVEQQTRQQANEQTNNKRITNKQQTNNNNVRSKEVKNERIEEDIISAENSAQKKPTDPKNVYGEFKNVKLTDNEAEKLHNEFGDNAVGMVDYLSSYKVEKNYKTKSDYLTIKRWVAEAYFKSLKSNSYGNGNDPTGIGYVSTERIVAAGRAMAEARR